MRTKNFIYDKTKDQYICPEGNILSYRCTDNESRRLYIIVNNACKRCRHFGICTNARRGRVVARVRDEDLRDKFEAIYQQPDSQKIYTQRKEKVELPFGHIKRNLKFDAFLLRGKDGAKAEISLAATCFNMARIITIIGVAGLIQKLQG